MMSGPFRFAILFFCLISQHLFAQGKPLSDLTKGGLPENTRILGENNYDSFEVQKLANPILLYVDTDWFREKGFDEGLINRRSDFEKEVLNILGFAAPKENEAKSAYKSAKRTWHPDRYGGLRMGDNFGSGRAASKGIVQIKGVGRTGLVNMKDAEEDPYHSNGVAILNEGIHEVIASQIAHRELPYGANRVIALIATGTFTSFDGKYFEPRVLIVREDPIRPAHFMANDAEKKTIDKKRLQSALRKIGDALPQPSSGEAAKTTDEKILRGLNEFVERLADVEAFSFARSLYHGALSSSNLEISGAALDFGSFTSFDGYPHARRLPYTDIAHFGDIREIKSLVITVLLKNLRSSLPAELKKIIPTNKELVGRFQETHERALNREMVLLTGAPSELISGREFEPILKELGATLLELAKAGNMKRIDASKDIPERTGFYNLGSILSEAAKVMNMFPQGAEPVQALDRALEKLIYSQDIRHKFIDKYLRFITQLESEADAQKIKVAYLRIYMQEASRIRNHKIYEIMRGRNWYKHYGPLIEEFGRTWDPRRIRQQIESAIQSGRRTFRDAEPFKLVLSETGRPGASKTRKEFDLKTGQIQTKTVGPFSAAVSCHSAVGP